MRWEDQDSGQALDCIMLVKAEAGQLETELTPEFETIRMLAGTGVPVPRALWLDADGSALGQPFFVTEHATGIADMALLREVGPNPRGVAEHMADVAAAIHTVDWQARGWTHLAPATCETAASNQVSHWEAIFLRHRMEPLPIVVFAFDWLREHAPVASRVAVVHGDLRIGKVLYDDGRITAVLDWEMVHLSDPIEDLAWAYRRLWAPSRVLPLTEFLERYTRASGIVVEPTCVTPTAPRPWRPTSSSLWSGSHDQRHPMIKPTVADLLRGIADSLADRVAPALSLSPELNDVRAAVTILRDLALSASAPSAYLEADNTDTAATLAGIVPWIRRQVDLEPLALRIQAIQPAVSDSRGGSWEQVAETNLALQHLLEEVLIARRSALTGSADVDDGLRALFVRMLERETTSTGPVWGG